MRAGYAVGAAAIVLLAWSCGNGAREDDPPDFALDGFEIELAPDTQTQVRIGRLATVFEETPGAIEAPPASTLEGDATSPAGICASEDLPLMDVTARQLGTWLAYAVRDSSDRCVATWQGDPRDGPSPPQLALENASLTWARSTVIVAPDTQFDESGITYYPPEPVTVRGVNGIYLREEGTGRSGELATHHLLWIADGAYWHLTGTAEGSTGDPGRYSLDALLLVADTLQPSRPAQNP